MVDKDTKQDLLDLVRTQCEIKNCTLLYACITGSNSYGNAVEGSDIDVRFVFASPVTHYLGFTKMSFIDVSNNDIAGYEFLKWAELLLGNNPTVLEMLFMEQESVLYRHPVLIKLFEYKQSLLSKKAHNSYMKYAAGQLYKAKSCTKEVVDQLEAYESLLQYNEIDPYSKLTLSQSLRSEAVKYDTPFVGADSLFVNIGALIDAYRGFKQSKFPYSDLGAKRRKHLKKYGYDSKNVAHAFRLALTCKDIFEKNELKVCRDDAQYFLDIKTGKYSLEHLEKEFEQIKTDVDVLATLSTLPEEPDREALEAMCVSILRGILIYDE